MMRLAVQVHPLDDRGANQGAGEQAAGAVHAWRGGRGQDYAHGPAGPFRPSCLPGLLLPPFLAPAPAPVSTKSPAPVPRQSVIMSFAIQVCWCSSACSQPHGIATSEGFLPLHLPPPSQQQPECFTCIWSRHTHFHGSMLSLKHTWFSGPSCSRATCRALACSNDQCHISCCACS